MLMAKRNKEQTPQAASTTAFGVEIELQETVQAGEGVLPPACLSASFHDKHVFSSVWVL